MPTPVAPAADDGCESDVSGDASNCGACGHVCSTAGASSASCSAGSCVPVSTGGSKTFGYTVPNPVAQTEVIQAAWERAAIDPRTISYIEAHGTGTSLGDPIEVEAVADDAPDSVKGPASGAAP